MSCTARIRPWVTPVELHCRLGDDPHDQHEAELRDFAYPGSLTVTVLTWFEDDRRNYRGDWVECPALAGCRLPANHAGRCAP